MLFMTGSLSKSCFYLLVSSSWQNVFTFYMASEMSSLLNAEVLYNRAKACLAASAVGCLIITLTFSSSKGTIFGSYFFF